ncbi:transporter substrate-binding domain-containing protein [Nitratireductor kimnyeongensis]|uniref:Transporter substrate-binding domain-containing protein n=1 Tax=Nitratireductor kimnyeongensis TaxID=430679 RepID=A0ABW0T5N7_9HYPH|nr:transporter substrate-binding domain-containing protein [Nitratireductor kimnyeongensis]QZZ34366.1 transporter substrate-binding domain-containing protein [Nitratireductor kimnyeongensis]
MTIPIRLCSSSAAALLATTFLVAGPVSAQNFDLSGVEAVSELADRVPQEIRDRGVLIIGSDNAYAPWEYLAGPDGQTPEGIDVDLGKAIAYTLGLKYESRTAPFASILPALGTNFDIGISAFSITTERMEAVNFVSYADTQSLWVVRAGNPTGFDPAEYCGATIAIQSGSYHEKQVDKDNEACVAAGKEPIKKLPFSVQTEANTRVAVGGADATATGGGTAAYAVVQSNGALENLSPVGPMGKRGLNGIAVPKDDMELTQLIADTLNHLIESGTYKDIYAEWGVGQFAVPEALVNPDVSQ